LNAVKEEALAGLAGKRECFEGPQVLELTVLQTIERQRVRDRRR
jgi:hypothetical protein